MASIKEKYHHDPKDLIRDRNKDYSEKLEKIVEIMCIKGFKDYGLNYYDFDINNVEDMGEIFDRILHANKDIILLIKDIFDITLNQIKYKSNKVINSNNSINNLNNSNNNMTNNKDESIQCDPITSDISIGQTENDTNMMIMDYLNRDINNQLSQANNINSQFNIISHFYMKNLISVFNSPIDNKTDFIYKQIDIPNKDDT